MADTATSEEAVALETLARRAGLGVALDTCRADVEEAAAKARAMSSTLAGAGGVPVESWPPVRLEPGA